MGITNISFSLDLPALLAGIAAMLVGGYYGVFLAQRYPEHWNPVSSSLNQTEAYLKVIQPRLRFHWVLYAGLAITEVVSVALVFLLALPDLNAPVVMLTIYLLTNAWVIDASLAVQGRSRIVSSPLTALAWVLTIAGFFYSVFASASLAQRMHSVHVTYTVGGTQFSADGYAGAVAVLALLTLVPFLVQAERLRRGLRRDVSAAVKSLAEKRKSSLSDDVLIQQISERMNDGSTVKATDFADEDRTRVINIMAEVQRQLSPAAVRLDATSGTISYENAEGVARVHTAFQEAKEPQKHTGAQSALIRTFLQEVGLPSGNISDQYYDQHFSVARATAGNLAAVIPSGFPIFVVTFTPNELRSQSVSMLFQQAFNAEHPEKRFGLILAPISSPLLRTLLTQPQTEGSVPENVVYLDEDDVRSIITNRQFSPQTAFMDIVRRSVRLKIVAPFITDGVTPSLVFKGRDRAMADILKSVDARSFAVVGGRRIGKTSLVTQVKLRLQAQGYEVFDMDCASVTTYEELFRTMRAEWSDRLAEYRFDDYQPVAFREMVSVLSAVNRFTHPAVFILEEIDRLLGYDIAHDPSEQLFRSFRDLSERRKCQFIFTGERRIFERFHDTSSPMFNFCAQVRPGLLDQEDACRLVQDPFALLGISIDETLADRIVDGASRHPNLIQWICSNLVDQMDEQETASATSAMIDEVLSLPRYRERYLEVFWGQATPVERAISLLLTTEETVDPGALFGRLQSAGFSIPQARFNTALEYLELYCVLRRSEAGISLEARHFPEYAQGYLVNIAGYIEELRKQQE